MDEWEKWGFRAKRHMKAAKVTQASVAEAMEITQGQVGHMLNGRRKTNLAEFFTICKLIGADPKEMLFGSAAPSELKKMIETEVKNALAAHPEFNPRYLEMSAKLHGLKKHAGPERAKR